MNLKTNKNQIITQNYFHILSFSLNTSDIKKDENFLDPAKTGFISCSLYDFNTCYDPKSGIIKENKYIYESR